MGLRPDGVLPASWTYETKNTKQTENPRHKRTSNTNAGLMFELIYRY